MPASIPGSTLAQNLANPSAGAAVIFDLISGPKGSPLDKDSSGNASVGALSTGIGFGSSNVLNSGAITPSFTDDYTPGVTTPGGTASSTSILMYIGGGKSTANVAGIAPTVPYTAGFGIGGAGNGGSRDAGAGPAFTGFLTKTVTATGTVANGSAVETGWTNRSGVSLRSGQSTFGSSSTGSSAPA